MSQVNNQTIIQPGDKCPICIEDFQTGEMVARGAKCNHIFHQTCLGDWTSKLHNSCPSCRAVIDENLDNSYRTYLRTLGFDVEKDTPDEVLAHGAEVRNLSIAFEAGRNLRITRSTTQRAQQGDENSIIRTRLSAYTATTARPRNVNDYSNFADVMVQWEAPPADNDE